MFNFKVVRKLSHTRGIREFLIPDSHDSSWPVIYEIK
jgi:hypothetical protein